MIIEITIWEILIAVFIASAIFGFLEAFFKEIFKEMLFKKIRKRYDMWRSRQRRLK